MRIVYVFEEGDKIVLKKEKEGTRFNNDGKMDCFLGRTFVVTKAWIGGDCPHYKLDYVNDEQRKEFEELRDENEEEFAHVSYWNWYLEMIDMEASIKANSAG